MNRETPLDYLGAFNRSVQPRSGRLPGNENFFAEAIIFDTAGLVNIVKDPHVTEIIDYVDSRHIGPVVVSPQVVQEFWNNSFTAYEGTAERIEKKFQELGRLIEAVTGEFPKFGFALEESLNEFRRDHGFVVDKKYRDNIKTLVEMLFRRATVGEAPRVVLAPAALYRKSTKTPPGFKDSGDGDFFVWCDSLLALKQVQLETREKSQSDGESERGEEKKKAIHFSRVFLVTDDTKKDWSTNGTPHPTLYAECESLLGASLRCLTVKDFYEAIRSGGKSPAGLGEDSA